MPPPSDVALRLAQLQETLRTLSAAPPPVPEDARQHVAEDAAELVRALREARDEGPSPRKEKQLLVALLHTCTDVGDLCPDLAVGLVGVLGDGLRQAVDPGLLVETAVQRGQLATAARLLPALAAAVHVPALVPGALAHHAAGVPFLQALLGLPWPADEGRAAAWQAAWREAAYVVAEGTEVEVVQAEAWSPWGWLLRDLLAHLSLALEVDAPDEEGRTLFGHAVRTERLEALQLMVEFRCVDVTGRPADCPSYLECAVNAGHVAVVEWMLCTFQSSMSLAVVAACLAQAAASGPTTALLEEVLRTVPDDQPPVTVVVEAPSMSPRSRPVRWSDPDAAEPPAEDGAASPSAASSSSESTPTESTEVAGREPSVSGEGAASSKGAAVAPAAMPPLQEVARDVGAVAAAVADVADARRDASADSEGSADSFARCIRELTISTASSEDGDAILGQIHAALHNLAQPTIVPAQSSPQQPEEPPTPAVAVCGGAPQQGEVPPAEGSAAPVPEDTAAAPEGQPGAGSGGATAVPDDNVAAVALSDSLGATPSPEAGEAEQRESAADPAGAMEGPGAPVAAATAGVDALVEPVLPEVTSAVAAPAVAAEPTPSVGEVREVAAGPQHSSADASPAADSLPASETTSPLDETETAVPSCLTCEVMAAALSAVGPQPAASEVPQRRVASEALALEVAHRYVRLARDLQGRLRRATAEADLLHDRRLAAARELRREQERHCQAMQRLEQQRAERLQQLQGHQPNAAGNDRCTGSPEPVPLQNPTPSAS